MERLTSERGNRCEICVVADNGKCLLNNTFPCAEYKIYAKLAAYEDTGLEPEEIKSLWANWYKACETIRQQRKELERRDRVINELENEIENIKQIY